MRATEHGCQPHPSRSPHVSITDLFVLAGATTTPNAGPGVLWPALLERAYAQQREGSYQRLESGHPTLALEALTGLPATTLHVDANNDDVWRALRAGVSERRPMVAGTRADDVDDGLAPQHAYAVLDACEQDGQRMVTLYNPWGTDDGASRPEQQISLEEFVANFGAIHIGGA